MLHPSVSGKQGHREAPKIGNKKYIEIFCFIKYFLLLLINYDFSCSGRDANCKQVPAILYRKGRFFLHISIFLQVEGKIGQEKLPFF